MAINKVIFGNVTLLDTSEVTVTPEKMVEGETALNAQGEVITGTNPYEKAATDETVDTQSALIDQIGAAMQGKGAGAGGGAASIGEDIHDKTTDTENYYIDGNKVIAYSGWSMTDYIRLENGKWYWIYSSGYIDGRYVSAFDADKNYVKLYSGVTVSSNCSATIAMTLLAGFDGYIRFSSSTSLINNLKVREVIGFELEE